MSLPSSARSSAAVPSHLLAEMLPSEILAEKRSRDDLLLPCRAAGFSPGQRLGPRQSRCRNQQPPAASRRW